MNRSEKNQSIETDLNLIREVISLNTVAGFIKAYEWNLANLGGVNKSLAYALTERDFELYYQRRKYIDNEVFYSALSRYYTKLKKETMV